MANFHIMNSTLLSAPTPSAMDSNHPEITMNPSTLLLDSFFPGFSLISSVLAKYLHIDVTLYLPILLIIGVITWASQHINSWLWDFVDTYLMSTVDIRVDDEMYNMVMGWIAKQKFAARSRRFVANTDINSRAWNLWWDALDDDEDDSDACIEFNEDGEAVAKTGKGGKQDKGVQYTPSFGVHYFWYKKRLLIFRRMRDTRQVSYGNVSELEEISLQSFGRNPQILKDLLAECRVKFIENDLNKTVIYRGGRKNGRAEVGWTRCAARASRPFSTVVLDEAVKESLVTDMREYLHQNTRRWYSNRGIPYRRGYLFYGPPGTGKSSLSFAIAGYFKLKIYVVSLNSGSMNEETLGELFAELPKQCVVLLEDIDTAGITKSRKDDDDKPKPLFTDKGTPIVMPDEPKPGPAAKISLSALLNVLDGVASQEGRILIMTTNHIEKLDEALIRPGRVDMKVKFDLASTEMVTTIFRAIFTTLEGDIAPNSTPSTPTPPIRLPKPLLASEATKQSLALAAKLLEESEAANLATQKAEEQKIHVLAQQLASVVPTMTFSPAEIQGYLLKHKCQPDVAVLEASAWVEKTLKEKKEKAAKEEKEKEEQVKDDTNESWQERMWAVGVGALWSSEKKKDGGEGESSASD